MPLADYVHDSPDVEDFTVASSSDLSNSEIEELAAEIIALLKMELRLERERTGGA